MSLEQNSRIFDHSPDHKSEQEPVIPALSDIFKEVKPSTTGERQVTLENWDIGSYYLDQAPKLIEEVLRRQHQFDVTVQKPTKQARRWLKPRRLGFKDSPEDATTALQEYIFDKIPNCTWIRNRFELFITRGVTSQIDEENKILIPRYVFTVILKVASGFRIVGEMIREFDVHAEYDEQTKTWSIHTDLVQTERDIDTEMKSLLDDWNNRVTIGKKEEEGRLRHPFHGGLPGGGQKS
jgi:hypothetical protein